MATSRQRVESVDLLRGVIMVLMALDHVREFFYPLIDPSDLTQTTVPLFFTRWITHICAPVFFLLIGVGSSLSLRRKSKRELSRFLLTRGLWLIVADVTFMRWAWQFNVDYRVTVVGTLFAIGGAMVTLAPLVYLPTSWVTAFGLILIAGHNALDAIHSSNPLWVLLHSPDYLLNTPRVVAGASYVLIPWVGVTALGYGLGQVYAWEPERRRRFLLRAGLAVTAAFVVLRAINRYGDPVPWTAQKTATLTVLAFLNTSKYPPSLLYLLMTLGPALMLLSVMDRGTPPALRPALVFGRVPLFYYLVHLPLIHLLAVLTSLTRYGQAHWFFESPDPMHWPFTRPPDWGFSLPIVYAIWVLVVVMMYPLCRWFAGVKRRRNDPWLSYL